MADTVRAAGGVLWRPAPGGPEKSRGGPEICVVHRPRYDDWSLPKGKLHDGEHPLAGAVREVFEETGVRARPQSRLPRVAYDLPGGVPKTVDFWLMRAGDAAPPDTDEVDDVAWLPLRSAAERVSYRDDARLIEHVAGLPPVTAVLPLVRHAHAGRRDAFPGDDSARPLDAQGSAEADALGPLLALFEPEKLYSATPLRCRRTLEPLAARLDLPVIADAAFDEPRPGEDVDERVAAAAARLAELRDGPRTVICSQGKVIPPLLALLDSGGVIGRGGGGRGGGEKPYATPKGTGWVLCFTHDRLTALDRL